VSFTRKLIIITGVIALLISLLVYTTAYTIVHPYIWYMLAFFVFVTVFTFYITRKGFEEDEENFQLYYFGSMAFRVIMCLAVVFIYVFFTKERHFQFTLNFFVLYFIFTGFEIYGILTNLRPISKKQV
jgi:FtsH-binding integral membrane protein